MRALTIALIALSWCATTRPARGDDERVPPRRDLDERAAPRGLDDASDAAQPDADDELVLPSVEPERHGQRGRLATAPKIGAVLAAAYAAAGLDHDPGRGWVRRTRLAGLIPWLTVRTTRDTSWQDTQSEVGHGTTLEVRATWRLDRLLFDGHELQVANLEAARRRERMRLSSHVIRAYFAWRRALTGERHASDDRTASAIAETTAELDALTDGWFSEELARPSGNPRRSDPP